jgi:N-acetylglutamate synthase-like GNAT family acetyltransferase
MSTDAYHVRRATVDDLGGLVALWNSMHLPAAELERRLTEFQLVESDDGGLLGAMGLEIIERQGRIHGEAFRDFALADRLRDQLWHRLQSVAANHGLARLWTDETAPFWKQHGFQIAAPDTLKKLPPVWAQIGGDWLTLRLRDEEALRTTLEMDLTRLKEQERQSTDRALRSARALKFIAIAFSIPLAAAVIVFCINLLRHLPQFQGR